MDSVQKSNLERRLDALSDRLSVVEEQNEWLEAQLYERDERIAELETRLDGLESRTELIDRVAQHNPSSRKHRAALLIQVLYNDAKPDGSASMTVRQGHENLNRSVDRTALYGIFEKAEQCVDNEDVLYVVTENRASKKNTRLVLDLSNGDVPEQIGDVRIKGGAD